MEGDNSSSDNLCIVCHKGEITYCPDSCKCPYYCKKCAMKMASGGKCKKCGTWYASFKRL